MAYITDDEKLAPLRAMLLPIEKAAGIILQRLQVAVELLNVSPIENPDRRRAQLITALDALKAAERQLTMVSVEDAREELARIVAEESRR